MKFKMTLRNAYVSRTFEQPFVLGNPLEGTIHAEDGYVYAQDDNTLAFSYSSKANSAEKCALTSATFQVDYTDIDGVTRSVTSGYTNLPSVSGLSYEGTRTIGFPAFLTEYPADCTLPVTLRATLTDAAGNSRDIKAEVPLRSHINKTELEIVKGSTTTFPVNAQFGVMDGYTLSSGILQWNQDGGAWQNHALSASTDLQTVNTTALEGVSGFSSGSYLNYRLKAVCSDGTAAFSPVWSMKFLRYDYEPAGVSWCDSVSNIDLSRGDYLEAKMTMAGSRKAGLLSIGDDISIWGNYYHLFHFFLGDKATTPSQYLRSALSNGSTPSSKDTDNPRSSDITISLDGSGLFVDGKEGNESEGGFCSWSKTNDTYRALMTRFANPSLTSNLQIGQNQGDNRSFSTYHYIRAVRQYEISVP